MRIAYRVFKWENLKSCESIILIFPRGTRYVIRGTSRAASSVGLERCFDRAEVAGSNPAQPTYCIIFPLAPSSHTIDLLFSAGTNTFH